MKTFQRGQKVTVSVSYGITHEGTIEQPNGGYPNYNQIFVKVSGLGDVVPVDLVSLPEGWTPLDGLYDAAYRAHSGTSFSPEDRARSAVQGYESELNADLLSIPADEKERYVENYKKHLFALMAAKSRCLSTMITGPANFPVRRAEKANQAEHNRGIEFSEWRGRALKQIAKNIEAAKPAEEKDAEKLADLKKQIDRLFEGWGVDRFRARHDHEAKTKRFPLVPLKWVLAKTANK